MNKTLSYILSYVYKPGIVLAFFCFVLSIGATTYFYSQNALILYGDAESHLNISKRVTSSLTPGLAQLGGVWLPLPHLLMAPLTFFDPLWRSGFAGSIISGLSYIVATVFLYRLLLVVFSEKRLPAFLGALVFALNPNILYMQSTAMTELSLIAFFMLSTYYFVVFITDKAHYHNLILAAFFGFLATLSRYDGWFLVGFEFLILTVSIVWDYWKIERSSLPSGKLSLPAVRLLFFKLQGYLMLFATLAFFGIILWLGWDGLILNDPFYFSNSPYSAKSQQLSWLKQGRLPSYHDLPSSVMYYSITSLHNIGMILSLIAVGAGALILFDKRLRARFTTMILLFVPFVFYVLTLYIGQSVIFLPELMKSTGQLALFNVRYGLMMVPFAAFAIGYLAYLLPPLLTPSWLYIRNGSGLDRSLIRSMYSLSYFAIILILAIQSLSFLTGHEQIITIKDGTSGFSASIPSDAEQWMKKNYSGGTVLIDDYARTMSVIRSGIPMQDVIYVGTKPYWSVSLKTPEKYAKWVVIQQNDAVWNALYKTKTSQDRLFTHYQKAYTSPEILVFKRNDTALSYDSNR